MILRIGAVFLEQILMLLLFAILLALCASLGHAFVVKTYIDAHTHLQNLHLYAYTYRRTNSLAKLFFFLIEECLLRSNLSERSKQH